MCAECAGDLARQKAGEVATEVEFLAQFDPHYAVQRVAKAVHFERHHGGMRTNGPSTVELPTELVEYLLSRWGRET